MTKGGGPGRGEGGAGYTFECLGFLVFEEVLLVVGLSGGSLAEEPVCVVVPPRDLVACGRHLTAF